MSSTWRCPVMLLALIAGCTITSVGCQEPSEAFTRVGVEGTVMLDDQPLDQAVIRFIPSGTTAGPKTTFAICQGQFSASESVGPAVGTHRVEIDLTDEGEFAHDDEQALRSLVTTRRKRIARPQLPAVYHRNSTLTARLARPADGSTTSLNFELSSRSR